MKIEERLLKKIEIEEKNCLEQSNIPDVHIKYIDLELYNEICRAMKKAGDSPVINRSNEIYYFD